MNQNGSHADARVERYLRVFPQAGPWLSRSDDERHRLGYEHTLLEILQQPETWLTTSAQVTGSAQALQFLLQGCEQVILTGSGSSEYTGECVRIPLQKALRVPVQTLGAGSLLTNGADLLPSGTSLMVSFARSGDSPESVAALQVAQHLNAGVRHLILTCNQQGRLLNSIRNDDGVEAIVLDARTNDRSLVMTSSFTNMALAALGLCYLTDLEMYVQHAEQLSETGTRVLREAFEHFPAFIETPFERAFYLAGPSLLGAARESALKMTEMTAGRVLTVCETYLGLRHGPMSAVHPDSLVVCFLSSNSLVRAYELDVVRELNEKHLGMKKLFIGSNIPQDVLRDGDLALDVAGFDDDHRTSILYVAAGQVLALLRCIQEGLHPDAPSRDGVINRVVGRFRIYDTEELATVA